MKVGNLNNNRCVSCGSDKWLNIPSANTSQSLTTACVLVNEPIGKAQCQKCGLVQRINEKFLGNTRYYEENYEGYYSRPGAEKFHAIRYNLMCDWIITAITPFSPDTILDVGCGQGGAMVCLRKRYPASDIFGIEPSVDNALRAEKNGFKIINTKLGDDTEINKQVDLVVAIYVLQHVSDPLDFLKGVKKYLNPNGFAAFIIPKSEVPNIELVWSDQNFSFCAEHTINLAKKAGLDTVSLHENPEGISPSWLAIFKGDTTKDKGMSGEKKFSLQKIDYKLLYKQRCQYMEAFKELDRFLCSKAKFFKRIINFGASFWTSILAAYCPNYWQKVEFCIVDNDWGEIMGKKSYSNRTS
jgi:SAM-dependent methyltransferase